MKQYRRCLMLLFILWTASTDMSALSNPKPHLAKIRLPQGFYIETFCDKVPGARSMTLSPEGILFVGTRRQGKVYALVDSDKDYRADKVITVASGLNQPNGVAFRNGSLFVAEINRIIRFDAIQKQMQDKPEPVVVNADFPTIAHHGWKYIAFGPDSRLYVPVGAPCNICNMEDERFASLMRMTPEGKNLEVFAHGIRNTVGFDWHPDSKVLWFTDNGRDWLGDESPPDELNRAPRPGMHFGYPFCHGPDIKDPKFGQTVDCSRYVPPAISLGPHVASLGMKFYTGNMFPEEYHHDIFIAEHGSWNRKVPIGYRITRVRLKDDQPLAYEVFAAGWLHGARAWGRPVDLLVMPDGSLLVSDDRAGAIYRITYRAGSK